MPTPSPTIVVMLSTKTDIVWNFAASVTSPRAIVIASTPTAIGSRAATSAPKASTRTTRVTGSTRCSPRAVGGPRQRFAQRGAEVGDIVVADVVGLVGGERGDEEGGTAVPAHEGGFAQTARRDDLANVRPAPHRGRERVQHHAEPPVGAGDG